MNNESENFVMQPLLTDCRNLLKEIPNKHVIQFLPWNQSMCGCIG